MNGDNYKAWDVKTDDYPVNGDDKEKTIFFLRYGILAPSVHNSQPWVFDVKALSIKISPDFSKSLCEADPKDSFMYMSMGACAETIEIAAEYFGYSVKRTICNGNSLLLSLRKKRKKTTTVHPDIITQRFSNKFLYEDTKVNQRLIDQVLNSVKSKRATALLVQDDEAKLKMVSMHLRAVMQTMKSKSFVRELSRKLISNRSQSTIGMPGLVIGLNNMQSVIIPKLIRLFPGALAKGVESKDGPLVKKTAGFGIIYSSDNSFNSMIEIGGIYQKMSLLLKNKGIHNSMLTAIVLQESERLHVEKLNEIDGTVRLFFRFGYPQEADKVVHTPRKNIWE